MHVFFTFVYCLHQVRIENTYSTMIAIRVVSNEWKMAIPYHHSQTPRVCLCHDNKHCTSVTTHILPTIEHVASRPRVGAKVIPTNDGDTY